MDNLQGQLDTMRHEDEVFRAHANKHFGFVVTEVTTKEDLRNLESRMSTELANVEERFTKIVEKISEGLKKTNETVGTMGETIIKIAEKVGVSP